MPRILHVITDLEVGGVPLHLLRLAVEVRQRGWDVRVISLKAGGPVAERLRAADVPVSNCQAAGPVDWRVFERLAGQIAEIQPDLVHALLFHANLAARIAGVLAGYPRRRILTEIQTVEIERRWHLLVERFAWRGSAATLGNSQSVLDHLHARGGVPYARLRLVPGGIDVGAIASAAPLPRVVLGARSAEKLLVWTGRLDPVKGLDVLFSALAMLPATISWRLLLAGDGPMRGALEAQAGALGIAERVQFLGRRDDVPRLLRSADVFVFPSHTEGLPNALLEAMAAGLPIVATDVPGNRDLVTDRVTGRLVPVGDAAALAQTLSDTLSDMHLAARWGAAAQNEAAARYDLAACVERYLAIYREFTGAEGL